MIDLNSLAIFAKVVETRSFSEAAKRLNMPISTVSRRVAELEDQLGVGLLERSTRNLRLTDVGAEVFEHAQRSAEISEAVGNIVSNQSSTVSGVLRLSALPAFRTHCWYRWSRPSRPPIPTCGCKSWSPTVSSIISRRGSI